MPETTNAPLPEPPCPICGAPVADRDYREHIGPCRDARARAARQKVLDKIKETYPAQFAQAERELAEEQRKRGRRGRKT